MTFEQMVGKVMSDEKFREALKADPEKALRAEGIKATPQVVQAFKTMDWNSIHAVAGHLKTAQGMSC
jgi:hypothetical protein